MGGSGKEDRRYASTAQSDNFLDYIVKLQEKRFKEYTKAFDKAMWDEILNIPVENTFFFMPFLYVNNTIVKVPVG